MKERDEGAVSAASPTPVVVLMPLYDDWEALGLLLQRLGKSLDGTPWVCEVVVADDGSRTEHDADAIKRQIGGALRAVTVLRLARNLGHQRAIAIGLTYIQETRPGHTVVVMDSDGEDVPEAVPRLLAASERDRGSVVFAKRSRRAERLSFRVFYRCYRILHRVLTGRSVSFGNFSAVPAALLPRVVAMSELWNHYPAAVLKSRLPIVTVRVPRERRLAGHSTMNLVALVMHGLSAIAVAGDVVGVRALIATVAAIGVSVTGLLIVVGIKLATDLAIPGWATFAAGLLVAILLQMISLALVFVFITLQSRNYSTFLPRRDYRDYLAGEQRYG